MVKKREEELKTINDSWSAKIADAKIEAEALETVIIALQEKRDKVETACDTLNDRLIRMRREQGELALDLSAKKRVIKTHQDGVLQLEERQRTLNEAYRALEEQKEAIEHIISTLEVSEDVLATKNATLMEDANQRLTEIEAAVKATELKLDRLKDEYVGLNKAMTAEREELVNRARLLDDRDKNLRIRERIVANQEATIQQNANLLDL